VKNPNLTQILSFSLTFSQTLSLSLLPSNAHDA
jgi:hypothetical protein